MKNWIGTRREWDWNSIDEQSKDTKEMMRNLEITTEELQIAINRVKERQIRRQQRNQSRRHQRMRWWDERNGETNLQRDSKAKWIYTRGMAKSEKKWYTNKVALKMSETTARSVLCQRCTICSRQYCTAEDQAGFRSSSQTTDHFATYRMIDQKCHEWGINMWTATIDFMKAFDSISHNSIWDTGIVEHDDIHFLRKVYKDQKATVLTDEESDMFKIKEKPNRVTLCLACSSTLFCRKLWKKTFHVGKRKGEWEYTLATMIMCSYLHPRKNSSKTCCANSKRSTEKVGLRIHPRTKLLSIRKEIEIDDMKVEILTWEERTKIRGPDDYIPRIRKRPISRIAAGLLGQRSTGTDRSWHRELTCFDIDFGFSTQWYPRRWITPLEFGRSQQSMKEWFNRRNSKCFASSYKRKTHNDQDSDISFENDTVDEIDTTVIEEEEWIESIKRSTYEAKEKM